MDSTTSEKCCKGSSVFHDRRLVATLIIVLLLLGVFLFAESIKSFREYSFVGSGVPVTNTISVSGEGEMFAIPDTAVFTFSVIETAETVAATEDLASEKVNAAVEALKEMGIEEKDIKTVSFNLYPKYEWNTPECLRYPCPGRTQVQTGFELNQSVQVKVRDTAQAGGAIETVTGLEVQNVSGLSFSVADEDEVMAEARTLAIEDAKVKAEALAEELGVRLVRIVGFNEQGGDMPMPYMARSEALGLGGAMDDAAVSLPAGEDRIVSNVHIVYEIR